MDVLIDDELLVRYLMESVTGEEKAMVEQWRAMSAENEKTVEQFYFAMQASDRLRVMKSTDADRALKALKGRIRQKNKTLRRHRIMQSLQRVAAVLFLPVVLMSVWMLLKKEAAPPVQYVEVHTNPGMISSFNLPDGSKVWLNGGSWLRYPTIFSATNREVQMSGQGYFEVTHHPERPFTVKTSDVFSLEVLGTSFNLSAYNDEDIIETTLVKGSVRLNILQNGKSVQQILKPSEKAIYSKKTMTLKLAVVEPEYDIAWKDNRILFKGHPMVQVMRTLGLYYNVRFVVKGDRVLDSEITGKFSNEQLPQVMEYLKIASGIKYRIEPGVVENGSLKPGVVEIWK